MAVAVAVAVAAGAGSHQSQRYMWVGKTPVADGVGFCEARNCAAGTLAVPKGVRSA